MKYVIELRREIVMRSEVEVDLPKGIDPDSDEFDLTEVIGLYNDECEWEEEDDDVSVDGWWPVSKQKKVEKKV